MMFCVSICSSSLPFIAPYSHQHLRQHYQKPIIITIPTFANKPSSLPVSAIYCSKAVPNSGTEKKRHYKVGEYPPRQSADSTTKNNNGYEKFELSNNRVNNNNSSGKNNEYTCSSRNREHSNRNKGDNSSRNMNNSNNNRRNKDRDNNSRNWDNSNNNSINKDRDNSSRNWDNGSNNSRNKDRDNSSRNRDSIHLIPIRDGGMNHKIKNINKKMDRRNIAKAWASTVTESLSDLILKKQWLRALEVFDMLKEQPFYQPKEGTYMKLIVLLGRCGQPQRAQQMFDTMLEEGIDPTPQLYTALLSGYCRSNLIDRAFSILEKMKSLPLCQPDVYTYSILIKACVDACRFDLIETLYSDMSERSITPNTVTQNTVLSGYGKAGKFDQMENVLSGMLASTSSEPDVWTMNSILGLFGNKGQIETMEKWYEKFRNFGIEPETRTFNILIGAYGKKRMYDKMSSVMEYMRKLSFPWTTSTYNNVIEAFSDSGDAKHMEHTFDQMRAEGIKADTKTFCCLIRGYANAGLFHKVISSAQLAGELEIPENTSFYNAIIFACAKADDLVEMERVFGRMKEKHCQPDSTTYSVMIDVYRSQGMSDKVYDLEQEREKTIMILDTGAISNHSPQVDEDIDLET